MTLSATPSSRRARPLRRELQPPSAWTALSAAVPPDLIFAFCMFLPLCFLLQAGMMGAAAFCGVTLAYAVVRRDALPGLLITRGFLLLPALLACFSMLWSEAPGESAKFGAELGVTLLAAILLSAARRHDMVLRGVAGAFAVYLVVSLLLGGTTKMGLHGEAFSGLSSSKNLLADIAATGAIFAVGALWLALRDRAWRWAMALAVTVLLALITVVMAKSAGAMASLAIALGAMALLAVARKLDEGMRTLAVCIGGLLVIVFAFLHKPLTDALVRYVSALFDKDPTLTGRTYIWERGFELIRERPLLGRGFGAFWRQGNPDAEGLWQFAGISHRSGFTFHNSLIEVLVQLGWTGVVVLGLVLAVAILCLAVRFVRRPSALLCVWGGALVFELSRMPVESIGYQPFFYSTVIITAALAMAFAEPPADRVEAGPQRATPPYAPAARSAPRSALRSASTRRRNSIAAPRP